MVQGVILNLIVDTYETRILGAENHVCELQLVLNDFLCEQVLAKMLFHTPRIPAHPPALPIMVFVVLNGGLDKGLRSISAEKPRAAVQTEHRISASQ
jgi:hypothetical protein